MNYFVVFAVASLAFSVSLNVDAASLDTFKDAAKTIAKSAADKADSVTEIPQTGGIIQTALHKTASIALDKGVDLIAAKYPIVGVAAPHIKKFSKPVLNAAHSKINGMFTKDDATTTAAPETTTTAAPVKEDGKKLANVSTTEKPSVMDKLKNMVGVGDNHKNDDEQSVEITTAKPAEKSAENAKENSKAEKKKKE